MPQSKDGQTSTSKLSHRIRSEHLIVFFGVLIAAAVTLGTLAMVLSARSRTIDEKEAHLQNLAYVLAEQGDRSFQSLDLEQTGVIERLKARGAVSAETLRAAATTEELFKVLKDKTEALPQLDALTIIDDHGKLLNFSRFWPTPQVDVSDRDYFKALEQDPALQTFVSEPVRNRGSGTWTVNIARKILGSQGQFIGIVLGAMHLAYFENVYDDLILDPGSTITLVRRDGVLLARYPRQEDGIGKISAAIKQLFVELLARTDRASSRWIGRDDGVEKIIAVHQLNGYPVVVTVSTPVESMLAGWRQSALQTIVIAFLMDLTIGVAGLLGLRQLRASANLATAANTLARIDALTGLPNRLAFNEELERAQAAQARTGRAFAVHLMNLDRFNEVNDNLGHEAGDDLLVTIATKLRTMTRAGDPLARLGGDEFAVLQRDVRSTDDAIDLAQRISDAFNVDRGQRRTGISVGVAVANLHAGHRGKLLADADLAMHSVKQKGGGTFCLFEAAMETRLQARRLLERDLAEALSAGELQLDYQPLLDLGTDRIVGFEALLRWSHARQGSVSPAVFIPLAEETGLIAPIGAWVLQEACRTAATWPSDIKVAVNLSPLQFKLGDVVSDVRAALAASGLPGTRLELEITESVLLSDIVASRTVLHALKELGASIALDDFGTGYSSLSYLQQFPFDKIKVDQSFIRPMETSESCRAIVKATLGLAKQLRMRTTGEGVETLGLLERLRAKGCSEAQGYLISRPMPAFETHRFLDDWQGGSAAPAFAAQEHAVALKLIA